MSRLVVQSVVKALGLASTDATASQPRQLADIECDEGTDAVVDVLIPLFVLCLMFGMGAATTFDGLKRAALKSPRALFTGAFCQFGFMPLVAYLLGLIADLDTALAISLVVVGSCPGGTTSQLFTYWANGDVALSISMTVFSTAAALFMQPLILHLYMQAIDPDTELELAVSSLIITLIAVLLPVLLGAWVNTRNPVWGKKCATIGSVAGACLVVVAIVYGLTVESHLFERPAKVWLCAMALLPVGMAFGYLVSRYVTKLSVQQQRTVAFETGMQNSTLGIAIVTLSFSVNGCIDRSLLTFPFLYSAVAVFEAMVLSIAWGQVPLVPPPDKAVLRDQVVRRKEVQADGVEATVYRSRLAKDGLIAQVPGDNAHTLYDNFFKAGVRRFPTARCLGTRGGPKNTYRWLTYQEVGNLALNFGRGLCALGAAPKGRVSLYSKNRAEWVIAEQGCNAFTLTTVPLYDTLGPDTASYIAKKMDVFAIVCAPEQVSSAMAIVDEVRSADAESAPGPSFCIEMDGVEACAAAMQAPVPDANHVEALKTRSKLLFSEVVAAGRAHCIAPIEPSPDDIATVCFTSGTTGLPKGAVLTHANLIACMAGAYMHVTSGIATQKLQVNSDDVHISYLPLAHMFERVTQVMLYRSGASVGFYRGDVKLLVDDIKTLHPTMFAVVPRLLNKIYAAVMGRINSSGAFKRWLFNKAYTAKLNKLRRTNVNVHGFYDSLVFQNIAASLGGCVRIMITGSAPLSSTVMEFLRICLSCEVLEGYGQTETSAASHITLPGDMSMGHVGVPLPCLEVKLESVPEMDYTVTDAEGPRGEVCFRGPNVFQGYFEDPEKTAAAVVDGWLHSGDIGRINPDGTLSIIDRRKNLFKLAQGEYVSPEKVENVYIQHPVVEQVWVHGNSLESFLVAIISVNAAELARWEAAVGSPSGNVLQLPGNATIHTSSAARLLKELTALGKREGLHSFEQAKSLAFTSELFAVDNGLLTPTFKLRRNDLRKCFTATITELYKHQPGALLTAGEIGLSSGDVEDSGGEFKKLQGAAALTPASGIETRNAVAAGETP